MNVICTKQSICPRFGMVSLHAASKRIIDFLAKEGVGTIIVGKNPLWKQETGMGKRKNEQ